MPAVYLSHPSDKLDHYFGARATEALRSLAEVRFNREPRELSTAELVADARGCDYLIAYRQTAGPESLFRDWPELRAFIRCAMDIRTVDVAAASAHGVLVTRASAGFVASGGGVDRGDDGQPRPRPRSPCRGRTPARGRGPSAWAASCTARPSA